MTELEPIYMPVYMCHWENNEIEVAFKRVHCSVNTYQLAQKHLVMYLSMEILSLNNVLEWDWKKQQ